MFAHDGFPYAAFGTSYASENASIERFDMSTKTWEYVTKNIDLGAFSYGSSMVFFPCVQDEGRLIRHPPLEEPIWEEQKVHLQLESESEEDVRLPGEPKHYDDYLPCEVDSSFEL